MRGAAHGDGVDRVRVGVQAGDQGGVIRTMFCVTRKGCHLVKGAGFADGPAAGGDVRGLHAEGQGGAAGGQEGAGRLRVDHRNAGINERRAAARCAPLPAGLGGELVDQGRARRQAGGGQPHLVGPGRPGPPRADGDLGRVGGPAGDAHLVQPEVRGRVPGRAAYREAVAGGSGRPVVPLVGVGDQPAVQVEAHEVARGRIGEGHVVPLAGLPGAGVGRAAVGALPLAVDRPPGVEDAGIPVQRDEEAIVVGCPVIKQNVPAARIGVNGIVPVCPRCNPQLPGALVQRKIIGARVGEHAGMGQRQGLTEAAGRVANARRAQRGLAVDAGHGAIEMEQQPFGNRAGGDRRAIRQPAEGAAVLRVAVRVAEACAAHRVGVVGGQRGRGVGAGRRRSG